MGFYDDRVIALMSAYIGYEALPDAPTEKELAIEQQQTDFEELYEGGTPFEEDADGTSFNWNPFDFI